MNGKAFEEVDISGDVGLRIRGNSLSDLFTNAAYGLYHLVVNGSLIETGTTISIDAEGESLEGLLIAFLNELIYHMDTHGFIGKKVIIHRIDQNSVNATIEGEEFTGRGHEWKLLLKAATYHDVHVKENDGNWSAFVMFDI